MFCLLIKYSWMLFWFLKYSIETAIFGSVHDYIQDLYAPKFNINFIPPKKIKG